MLESYTKAPVPWYGGKRQAAPRVWALLGDVAHYVEPFCGTMAVLLERPHPCNRPYSSETVNDQDGLLINAWRSIQWHPDATAEACSWPVSEVCKQARQAALLEYKASGILDLLAGSPEWCDPQMGGWWLYAVCCQIGAFHGVGPWTADPVTGRLVKRGTREPGVWRTRPHLTDDGQGVHHAGLREPGVSDDPGFHPLTMPELRRWFQWLSARLRHVRIVHGDWRRVCTEGARLTLNIRQGDGHCGVFLDPPYSPTERDTTLYMQEGDVTAAVQAWCLEAGQHPRTRIVLAGYDTEHQILEAHGWTVHEWYTSGFLRGGYGNIDGSSQQHRERVWASPHCVPQTTAQLSFFPEASHG